MPCLADNVRRVNPLAKILVFAAGVVVAAALLAPPVFWLCNALADAGWAPGLAKFPFFRYFSRIAQIAALVSLWPLIRWLRIRGWSELGIARNARGRADLGAGLAAAIVPLALLAGGTFGFDVFRARDSVAWGQLPRIVATAGFVAVFEEFLFRGVLLGLAARHLGRAPGALAVSAIYSVIHFVKPRAEIPREAVTWLSGFELLGSAFQSGTPPGVVLSGCVTLFVIGLILAWAAARTRSLWLPIGLHAGWIFGQQVTNLIGKFRIKPPDALMPWLGPNVVSGMVPTGVIPLAALLVTGLLAWWYLGRGGRARVDSLGRGAG